MHTIDLIWKSSIKTVPVSGIEKYPIGLKIRWGFAEYVLSLHHDQLLYVDGNRIARRYPWRAKNPEDARRLYDEILAINEKKNIKKR